VHLVKKGDRNGKTPRRAAGRASPRYGSGREFRNTSNSVPSEEAGSRSINARQAGKLYKEGEGGGWQRRKARSVPSFILKGCGRTSSSGSKGSREGTKETFLGYEMTT